MKVKHYNRTERVWSGNITFFVDVGDDCELEIRLYRKTGNQYQQTPFKRPKNNFCFSVKTLASFEELRQASNLPAKEVCPWPKGNYEIFNHKVINSSRWPPSFDGDYMVETRFYKNNELQNGYQVFVTVINP